VRRPAPLCCICDTVKLLETLKRLANRTASLPLATAAVPHSNHHTKSSELLEITVTGAEGFERKIIVTSATPLFHTHRVLQWCVKPHQSDDTVAAQVSVQQRTAWLWPDQAFQSSG
jgi:hypothetical protein